MYQLASRVGAPDSIVSLAHEHPLQPAGVPHRDGGGGGSGDSDAVDGGDVSAGTCRKRLCVIIICLSVVCVRREIIIMCGAEIIIM